MTIRQLVGGEVVGIRPNRTMLDAIGMLSIKDVPWALTDVSVE